VRYYGLADFRLAGSELGGVVEFYLSREEAEAALRGVLTDEPDWEGEIRVVEVDLAEVSEN
jgi:hypothetical protein